MPQPDRAQIKLIVQYIRDNTVCEDCGAQPIEWHNLAHAAMPRRRISAMLAHATIGQLIDEILHCTPLCSKCHKAAHPPKRPARRASYWHTIPIKVPSQIS